jgi:hypothetical protein
MVIGFIDELIGCCQMLVRNDLAAIGKLGNFQVVRFY